MNIEVGEYIRTKQGDIDKVILEYTGKCANPNCSAKHISCKLNYYDEEDIVSHSKSIIDLLQVGDYLDGVRVSETFINNIKYLAKDYNNKSIVTKQQFSNMEYKL